MEEEAEVAEAIRRLPQGEKDLRLWRLKRALDLSMKKNILPKEQWTTEEEVIFAVINFPTRRYSVYSPPPLCRWFVSQLWETD